MKAEDSVLIKNVYYMLSYAFQALKREEYADVEAEDFDNIHNLFASIISKGLSRQLKQGLHREYVQRSERLSVMRGALNFAGTIHEQAARRRRLACEYDELTADNLLNQAVKAAALLLYRHPSVEAKYKKILRQELLMLAEVEDVNLVHVPWLTIRLSRNNASYQLLLGISQLIAEGMLLGTDEGQHRLAKFVDDQAMSRLYEKFLLEYFRLEHPSLKVGARQVPWALDNEVNDLLPSMNTDVTIEKDSRVLIIDAKYYGNILVGQYDSTTVRSAHLYQLFAYVKNKQLEVGDAAQVSGLLLYAQTNEGVQPDVTYSMSGNELKVRSLGLDTDFTEIRGNLDRVVGQWLGTRVG